MTGHGAAVLLAPAARRHVATGFVKMADLVARTLGPQAGAIWQLGSDGAPEAIGSAADLARHVIELSDRRESTGAMMLRHLVHRVDERYGDGCASAAVLARELVRGGARLLAAGVDAVALRRGVEDGCALACQELERQARPAASAADLAGLADSASGDATIGALVGELFDMVGEDGAVVVNEHSGTDLDREYVRGGRWSAHAAARLIDSEAMSVQALQAPLVAVTDTFLDHAAQVRPLLEAALSVGDMPLLIVCRALQAQALQTVVSNLAAGRHSVAAVVPESTGDELSEDLDDIALLTGAVVLGAVPGWRPEDATPDVLGRANRAVLHSARLLLIGGGGDRDARQSRVAQLRARLLAAEPLEPDQRRRMRLRLGRLAGGVGVLLVGGSSEPELAMRRYLAERAVRAVELAHAEGTVPGGGAAYLACLPAIRRAIESDDSQRAVGLRLLASALEAPMRQLVINSGREAGPVLARVLGNSPGSGFDLRHGCVRPMATAGVVDSLPAARGALQAAVSGAVAALGVEAVVLRSEANREVSVRP